MTSVKNRCQQAFSTNVEKQKAGIHELCIVIKSFNRLCLEFPYVLCQSLQRRHHSATATLTLCCVLKAASLWSRPRLWWPWGCRSRQWWWLGLSGIRSRVCESAARQRHHTLILHTTAERGRRQAPPLCSLFQSLSGSSPKQAVMARRIRREAGVSRRSIDMMQPT